MKSFDVSGSNQTDRCYVLFGTKNAKDETLKIHRHVVLSISAGMYSARIVFV